MKKPHFPQDPNAPKRPLSSYILFANEIREEVRAAHPDAKMGELGKVQCSAVLGYLSPIFKLQLEYLNISTAV